MSRYAVIDVGTNSVKFHIGERGPSGAWGTVVDRAEVTRLGENLQQTGELAPQAMRRTLEAIAGMAEEARRNGVAGLVAVGTEGMRIARNSGDFIDQVRRHCRVEIEVIPGEEEGRLAYVAVQASLGLGEGSLVVFDTGGGSTQFTFGHGHTVDERFSVKVGAVRYAEKFGLDGVVTEAGLRPALEAIAADLTRLDGVRSPDALIGMGGATTNIAAVKLGLVKYDPDAVQGSTPLEGRRRIVGLQPSRAEVILAGACIVRTVMEKLGKDTLSVSDRGLRHGLLVERFGNPAQPV